MWDTDIFFSMSPSGKVEAAEPGQARDPCACCVSRVLLLCDTSPRMENPRELLQRGSGFWRLFPQFYKSLPACHCSQQKTRKTLQTAATHNIFDVK